MSSWWLLPILAIGAFFRLFNLTAIALWHDEAFSVLMVEYPVKEMIQRLILDVHPPGYYLFFYYWNQLFGNSLFSLRFFSVLAGLLILILLWWLVKRIFSNRKLALATALVAAVSPFLVLYSQEGRMYALGLFFLLAATLSLWYAVREKKVLCWFFFILFSGLACYAHYYLLFSILALFLFIGYLAWSRREERPYLIKSGLLSAVALFLFYLPWLPHFWSQLQQVQEAYWIPKMTLWSIPNTLINLLTGGVLAIGESNWWLGLILIGAIVFLFWRGVNYLKAQSPDGTWLILLSLLTPFVLAILLSLKQSLYLDRYFIFIVPWYLIILTAGIYSLKPKNLRYSILTIFILLMSFSYFQFWEDVKPDTHPGMAAAEDYLNIRYDSQDKILVTSSFVYFTFKYYNQTGIKPYLYAPGELSHFSGTALLDQSDIVKDFKGFAQPNQRVWLISTSGFGSFRPKPPISWARLSEEVFADSNWVKGNIFVEEYVIKK